MQSVQFPYLHPDEYYSLLVLVIIFELIKSTYKIYIISEAYKHYHNLQNLCLMFMQMIVLFIVYLSEIPDGIASILFDVEYCHYLKLNNHILISYLYCVQSVKRKIYNIFSYSSLTGFLISQIEIQVWTQSSVVIQRLFLPCFLGSRFENLLNSLIQLTLDSKSSAGITVRVILALVQYDNLFYILCFGVQKYFCPVPVKNLDHRIKLSVLPFVSIEI